jgi:Tfp pilus assembly protein PilO
MTGVDVPTVIATLVAILIVSALCYVTIMRALESKYLTLKKKMRVVHESELEELKARYKAKLEEAKAHEAKHEAQIKEIEEGQAKMGLYLSQVRKHCAEIKRHRRRIEFLAKRIQSPSEE